MSSEVNRREPGKRVFPSREHPKRRLGGVTLVLVAPAQQPKRPDVRTELSPEVKEMLREMNRRQARTRNTDAPDAA